jgi:hypothetical protein
MGQHKTNPVAIAAKEGLLKPNAKKMGKPQRRRLLRQMALQTLKGTMLGKVTIEEAVK